MKIWLLIALISILGSFEYVLAENHTSADGTSGSQRLSVPPPRQSRIFEYVSACLAGRPIGGGASASAAGVGFSGLGCVRDGCSRTICRGEEEEPMMTTCEWREVYSCYRTARCERQSNGRCGFTQTSQSSACFRRFGESR
jgi:eight-cysteine-cluster-containing protein